MFTRFTDVRSRPLKATSLKTRCCFYNLVYEQSQV